MTPRKRFQLSEPQRFVLPGASSASRMLIRA
jgi:hypothetical protein